MTWRAWRQFRVNALLGAPALAFHARPEPWSHDAAIIFSPHPRVTLGECRGQLGVVISWASSAPSRRRRRPSPRVVVVPLRRRTEQAATTARSRPVPPYFPPAGSWATVEPTAVGWDPVALQAALDFAGQRATNAMVVVVGGRIVAQQSWGVDLGFARDIASAQKSVVALLVGNLADARRMQIDESVATYLGPRWSKATPAQEAAITVRHLLTMTSGLADDLTFEAAPGTVWRYNTNAYQQLPRLVETVGGDTIDAITRAELFDPIGVSATSRWRDRPGLGPLSVDPNGRRIHGLVMTAPDMARVGLLVARRGSWKGRAVLTDPRIPRRRARRALRS